MGGWAPRLQLLSQGACSTRGWAACATLQAGRGDAALALHCPAHFQRQTQGRWSGTHAVSEHCFTSAGGMWRCSSRPTCRHGLGPGCWAAALGVRAVGMQVGVASWSRLDRVAACSPAAHAADCTHDLSAQPSTPAMTPSTRHSTHSHPPPHSLTALTSTSTLHIHSHPSHPPPPSHRSGAQRQSLPLPR